MLSESSDSESRFTLLKVLHTYFPLNQLLTAHATEMDYKTFNLKTTLTSLFHYYLYAWSSLNTNVYIFSGNATVQIGEYQFTEAGIVEMNKQQFNDIIQVIARILLGYNTFVSL